MRGLDLKVKPLGEAKIRETVGTHLPVLHVGADARTRSGGAKLPVHTIGKDSSAAHTALVG